MARKTGNLVGQVADNLGSFLLSFIRLDLWLGEFYILSILYGKQ